MNYDLLSSERGSFIYLGEGYLRYAPQDWDIRIGRLALETPMANADNPRFHRNTHEGVFASYGGIESTALNVGYIKRWAGYGAPGDFTRFHRFDADETFSGESRGMAMMGIEHEPMEHIRLKGWYFSIDKIADIYTADIEYQAFQDEDISVTLYGQYVEYNEQSGSGYDGRVGGIGIEVEHEPFSFYAAYNHGETKEGKQILSPYGRGPFLVDLEEFTIQEMQSPKAWMVRGGYAINEEFGVELMHGEFKMSPTHSKLSETAGVITYNEDQPVSARMSYAKVKDHHQNMLDGSDMSYDRFIVSMHYKF